MKIRQQCQLEVQHHKRVSQNLLLLLYYIYDCYQYDHKISVPSLCSTDKPYTSYSIEKKIVLQLYHPQYLNENDCNIQRCHITNEQTFIPRGMSTVRLSYLFHILFLL